MAFNIANLIKRESRFSDYILNVHFHLMDVSFTTPVILTPEFGFKTCTAPEINLDTKEVKEGNYEFKRSVITGGSVSDITFTQGVRFGNSDFADWIKNGITGKKSYRRNLLLVQFSQVASNTVEFNGLNGLNNFTTNVIAGAGKLFSNDLVSRIPARAWLLRECIPVRYRAGSDFDAMAPEVSLMELTIKYTEHDEFNTGI